MAVLERNLSGPAAVRAFLHWVCVRGPIVKVANDGNVFCLWREEQKVDGLEIVFCRVAIWATKIIRTNVKHPTYLRILTCYDLSFASENSDGAWERVKKAESVPWCKRAAREK